MAPHHALPRGEADVHDRGMRENRRGARTERRDVTDAVLFVPSDAAHHDQCAGVEHRRRSVHRPAHGRRSSANGGIVASMSVSVPGFGFDVAATLRAMVTVSTRVSDSAMTAGVLGTERQGHGALIDSDGLIVTIGYLIAEAESVWITTHTGQAVPAYVVGYDYETGFGLIRALSAIHSTPIVLGESANLAIGEPVLAAGAGRVSDAVRAAVVAKREFAGYWEYLLDEALFTAPAHPNWGGAALLGTDGRMYGVGSLLVQVSNERGETGGANMFVPIDLLRAVLDDLCRYGASRRPPRPWLGFFVQEVSGCLAVSGLYSNGPAAQAGIEPGDIITAVGDEPVATLPELFRTIWELGTAGIEVPISILRSNMAQTLAVRSVDRNALMRTGSLH
jgi:S1-C subfamily serine protease